jgi:hypothetical protein
MNTSLKAQLLYLLLLPLSFSTHACGDKNKDICAAGSLWYDSNVVSMAIAQLGVDNTSNYRLTVPDPLNISIDIDATFSGTRQKGTVKLVEGRAMLMRNLEISDGYEIDALDGPALMFQLLVTLMSQSIHGDPEEFVGSRSINHKEKKKAIRIATASASGYFSAPWTITGTVTRIDDESIDYDLEFTYTNSNISHAMSFKGIWQKLKHPPKIDNSMPLSGWKLYTLGPLKIEQKGGTILDYAAQEKPVEVDTLGKLREVILSDKNRSTD